MSIQAYSYQFRQNTKLVDPKTGIPTQDGIDLLLALYNRTGKGTGIIPVVSPHLAAAGNSQATALALSNDWNYIGTTPGGSGVVLLPLKPGNDMEVFNGGGSPLNIYPASGYQIDALAVNAPYVLNAGKLRIFQCWTLSLFVSLGN